MSIQLPNTSEMDLSFNVNQRPALPGGKLLFNQRYEIDLDKKLPQYSNGFSQAFQAKDVVDDKSLISFICDPAYPPRINKAQAYAQILNPCLPQLVSAGVVDLPARAGQRLGFFYEDSIGKPVFTPQPGLPIAFGWRPDRVLEKVISPILLALKEMRLHDMVHGGIRIENIFDGGRDKNSPIMLGECLSSPASIAQPILFEPLLRGMAMPSGRGAGLLEDDLYSLGVVVAILLRTKDPLMKRKSESDIVVSKMINGTYATLIGPDDNIGGTLVEFIRGTLVDDARQRWTLDDALTWLDGRRLSPKQSAKKKKAPRSISFNGKNIFYAEFLAREIVLHPSEAVTLTDTSELEQWIDRSLDDSDMLMRYQKAMKSAADAGRGPAYADRLSSRLAIAIDPEAPIRYKGLSFTLEGLGVALAEAFITGRELATFADIFSSGLIAYYLGIMTDINNDVSAHVSKQESCKNYVKHNAMGFGLERVLYHLNEDVQCLSPLVTRFFVRTPDDFLNALETLLVDDAGKTKTILDRHSVAFLAAKDSKLVEPYLYEISSPMPFRQVLGTLQILGGIQRYYRTTPKPNVCRWLLPQLEMVIERYHDANTQEEIRARIKKYADAGDLGRMHLSLDTPEQWNRDIYNFRRGIGEYRTIENEKQHLKIRLRDPKKFGSTHGRESSIVVAGIVSALVMLGFIMLSVTGKGTGFL